MKINKSKKRNTYTPTIELYKNLLLWFMFEKNKIVKSEIGRVCFSREDYKEVEDWSETDCKEIFENICNADDSSSCPWCHKFGEDCYTCSYGDRHGICDEYDSRYFHIQEKLTDKYGYDMRINELDGMDELADGVSIISDALRYQEDD